jgi:D-alanyl-D-alanine carboxypeptidase (penicillin-binding protein 5/6)
MLSLVTSVLLLGTVPAPLERSSVYALPDIGSLAVAAPAALTDFAPPSLTASGVLLMDVKSGQVVYDLDGKTARSVGSLAKIMTALLILERHNLDEIVTVDPLAASMDGSALHLKAGEKFTIADLLRGMLIPSANDAAYALALHDSPSIQDFVTLMNVRAQSLGLTETMFENPAGYDDTHQESSPRDLAWLTMAALRHPFFRETVRTRDTTITANDGVTYALHNTHELLHSDGNVTGVKTGTTASAGQCVITQFIDRGHTYLAVVLGSRDRYRDTKRLMQAVEKASF